MSSNTSEQQSATQSFSVLKLPQAQLENLDSLGYVNMTPVQAASLPQILDEKDLIVQAKTGSGKTAAFGLGLLDKINPRFFGVQSMVLCPTRELADQVANELRSLARCIPNIKIVTLCGGTKLRPQADSLEHGAHIVVGTPGRIQDHLSRQTLDISQLETLVLDEADRMLDMGFQDEINHIVRETPESRQTLLFSATFPDSIKKMCRSIQKDSITVKVDSEHQADVIQQVFYKTNPYQRKDTLLGILEHYAPQNTVVFCHTKIQCAEIELFLQEHDIDALALHGDLEQRERDQVLVRFSNNSCSVLVATDVAARGLDIKSLGAVINYELPHDPEIYVHRIGRTGRAGENGLALSIYLEDEVSRIIAIEDFLETECINEEVESLNRNISFSLVAPMTTLQLDSGKKNKLRPGDLLGALTKDAGLDGSQIGKINIFDTMSYVAIDKSVAAKALQHFRNGKVKGRNIRAREIR
ncbi:ATP-dependent RNA helicase DbpA [uncultured Cocleimonas sp.]|uniref:ATP-dependent RNA helicase DbpA n=1 Tax=uncultured Cocleimonas sp. TaxID=1051587 RepID=UPI00262124BD|nr:ATP-dependent RNA helicase DbpA [uncultured Cocleimonas sp.]